MFHYCQLKRGDAKLDSLFRVTNLTYNKLDTYDTGSASLTKETNYSDKLFMRKDLLSFVTCTTNPPLNAPKLPKGISKKMTQQEFDRRSKIDYDSAWHQVQDVCNPLGMYLAYFVRHVRSNQGVPTKLLRYDFEQPWSTMFKCNAEFQARVGSQTGCVVGTWSFLKTSTVDGKMEERKKMLAPFYILLSFWYDSKPKFTPLAQEICSHASKNQRYKDNFKALATLGPRMLNVRQSDEVEVGPDEEPNEDDLESDNEFGSDVDEEKRDENVQSANEDTEG
jgi:hypothetical protein